jgi:hypothetical protein
LIIANNPQISDYSLIYPGDILCVPIPLTFPACTVLKHKSCSNICGTAVAEKLSNGKESIQIKAVLPPPSTLGNFDTYFGQIDIAGIGGFGFLLKNIGQNIWEGSDTLPPLISSGNRVTVIPGNTQTGAFGQPILEGTFTASKNECVVHHE